jgi:2-methylcitrate dehydratase PrpD
MATRSRIWLRGISTSYGTQPSFLALAMAERQKASGKDFITSILVSYDVTSRIIDATRPSFKHRSKYYSCSPHAFGATIAAAKILKLNESAICDAIGISAYTAPLANLNLWLKSKPASSQINGDLYWHCETGIEAALLVERGFKGPQGALDKKEWGFWASISDRCNWRILTSQLGEEFYLKKNLTEDSLCPPDDTKRTGSEVRQLGKARNQR